MLNQKPSQQLKLTVSEAGPTPLQWLWRRSEAEAERIAFSCGAIDPQTGPKQQLSYAELALRAKALAVKLCNAGVKQGDRIAILLPNGLDYVVSVYAILAAGGIAVPLFPVGSSGHNDRLQSVLLEVKPTQVIVTGQQLEKSTRFLAAMNLTHTTAITAIADENLATHWQPAAMNDIAFLQYTSGSTSAPKGVMVSHSGLLANSYAIGEVFDHNPVTSTCGVSWLPLFHDMGMVSSVFHSVHYGCPVHLMAPVDFLKRPADWLRAMSLLRGHSSGGPNFAYDACVEQITDEQMQGIDLSHWEVAFNGSEPVSSASIDRFCERFEPWGFKRTSMLPCYGLAEFTLLVSGGRVTDTQMSRHFERSALALGNAQPTDATDDSGKSLIASGNWVASTQVRIIDSKTNAKLGDGQVGEILVRGPDKAIGYWKNAAATAAVFGTAANDPHPDFLRTGDNGFILDGQLFVTGRCKEMIVMRGRNLYPHDIEAAALDAIEVHKGARAAAFSVNDDSGERLVVACEAPINTADPAALGRQIRLAVATATGIQPSAILLVRKASLPRTSSGKLRRTEIAERFHRQTLDEFYRNEHHDSNETRQRPELTTPYREPSAGLEQTIAQVWQSVLRIEKIGADDNFLALGGDSVTAVQIASRLGPIFGVEVELSELFDTHTIAEVGELINREMSHRSHAERDDELVEVEI